MNNKYNRTEIDNKFKELNLISSNKECIEILVIGSVALHLLGVLEREDQNGFTEDIDAWVIKRNPFRLKNIKSATKGDSDSIFFSHGHQSVVEFIKFVPNINMMAALKIRAYFINSKRKKDWFDISTKKFLDKVNYGKVKDYLNKWIKLEGDNKLDENVLSVFDKWKNDNLL